MGLIITNSICGVIDLPFQGDCLMRCINPRVLPWVELSWAFSPITEINFKQTN